MQQLTGTAGQDKNTDTLIKDLFPSTHRQVEQSVLSHARMGSQAPPIHGVRSPAHDVRMHAVLHRQQCGGCLPMQGVQPLKQGRLQSLHRMKQGCGSCQEAGAGGIV